MPGASDSIKSRYPLQARVLLAGLAVTTACLAAGLVAPMVTLSKFYFIDNTFSILSGLGQLLAEGKLFLFVLILVFSVGLPILKIIVLWRLLNARGGANGRLHRYLHLMHQYGKWSMLDVFVVAVLVVVVKLGMVASVETHYGLYAFAAAVLLTMVITARVIYLAGEMEKDG